MDLVQTIINGILLGGLYGAIGLGLSLYFGVMRVINLAIGDLAIVSAYFTLVLTQQAGVSLLTAALVVLPLMFGVGVVLQRYVIQKTLGRGILPPLMVTFGIAIILQNVMLLVFSADAQTLQTPLATGNVPLVAGLTLPTVYVVDLAVALLLVGSTIFLFRRTGLGRALRATSDDAETAQLMGLSPRYIYGLAAGLSITFAAAAGILLGTTFTFYPSTGAESLLIAFETVVIGGLGSLWGTLIGGMLFGLAQLLGANFFGPSYGLMAGHVMFLLVLLVRPQGLLPETA